MAEEIGLFEAMYSQRAIRRLKPDPVSDDLIHKLIEAATKAPSGGNRQPWAFIVIRDPAAKRKIGEWYLDAWNRSYGAMPEEQRTQGPPSANRVYRSAEHLAHHLGEAPVLILVCARGVPPQGRLAGAALYPSIFPAVQNLLLAARGLNLGASLTTMHMMHEAEVKELLKIPDTVSTVALIPVGHPDEAYGPTTRRPVERVTHYERWDA